MLTVITEVNEEGRETTSDVFAKLLKDRIIFIYDIIEDNLATEVVASLLYLDSVSNEDIKIYINSEGGDLRSVFMIYDVINMLKSPVHTVCVGSAMDEAAVILAAGDKGLRFATKSSVICLSQYIHTESMYSDLTDAKIALSRADKDNKSLISALSKATGKSYKKVLKDCENKLFLSAQQAKKYGIVDKIVEHLTNCQDH